MSSSSSAKVCRICHLEVSGQPRVKDPAGYYYCKQCYEQAVREKQVLGGGHGASPASPVADAFAPQSLGHLPESFHSTPCPSCGGGLAPGAVICTTCGFNVHTGAHMHTAMQRAEREASWPTVIGVISIVFASCAIALYAINAINQLSAGRPSSLIGIGFGVALSAWLLSSGVGLIRRNSSAVGSIKKWAITKITLMTFCFGALIAATLVMNNEFSQGLRQGLQLNDLPTGLITAILLGTYVWLIFWPVFVLIWFGRAKVQKEVANWS